MEILIYAVIAAILVYRLYTILGTRDGAENKREQSRPNWRANAGKPAAKSNDKSANKDDLLALPLALPTTPPTQPSFATEPALASLAGAIFAIQKADPSFDERGFLKGARAAFEMIVRAFTTGDRGTLKNLLTPKLYVTFESAISAREAQGERWEMKTLILRDMDLVDAQMDGSIAVLTVQCVSDQSKMIYDKNGVVLKDPGRDIERLTDVWTFSRDTKSSNPNWQLVETHSV